MRRAFKLKKGCRETAGRVDIVGWFEHDTRLSGARIVIGAEDGGTLAGWIDTMEKLPVE